MATYLEQVRASNGKLFQDVPVTEEGVDTLQFLEGAEVVVKLFDLLGNKAFAVVQNDLNGNIKKVRDRHAAKPAESSTLEKLVRNEKAEGKTTATQGLLWLLRGLQFTYTALKRSLENPSEELSVSFTKAYEATLKQFHSFVVKPLFTLAMKACPYRVDFFQKLGQPQDVVEQELGAWIAALEKQVVQVQTFLVSNKYDKGL